jgi:2'-5' RNA ligase
MSSHFAHKKSSGSKLFFIALLPPVKLQAEITAIKQDLAIGYNSSHALKSPPHITLYPPFKWFPKNLPLLEQSLSEFGENYAPIPVRLDGFGAFPPRVIFIHPLKTPELMAVQADLMSYLETNLGLVDDRSKKRSFAPHLTVAFKDLKKQAFKAAWPEFRDRSFQADFTAHHLTLLSHNGQRWNIHREFPFRESATSS